MMRVIVEIHPGGVSARKRTIAQIDFANVSPDGELVPYYEVTASLEGHPLLQFRHGGHVRAQGWVPLVARVLDRVTWAHVNVATNQEIAPKQPKSAKRKMVMTSFQRDLLAGIAAGGHRQQSRNASRAYNILFRLDYLTDVDPVDNRRAIGGCYLTQKGRAALKGAESSPIYRRAGSSRREEESSNE